jgi:hypothetical protein
LFPAEVYKGQEVGAYLSEEARTLGHTERHDESLAFPQSTALIQASPSGRNTSSASMDNLIEVAEGKESSEVDKVKKSSKPKWLKI